MTKANIVKKRSGASVTTYKGNLLHVFNKHWGVEQIDELADELLSWIKQEGNIWVKDFCLQLNINRQRLTDFRNRSDYFDYIYSLVIDWQESKLLHMGLKNGSNTALVIFALKHNHKWSEQSKIEPEDVKITVKLPAGFEI